jgi:predicted esterase YcpF (UPF0227 family)
MPSVPRFLYLHGFASSPESRKAKVFAEAFRRRAADLDRLDLRRPSMAELRISAMMAHVRERIGGPTDRAVLVGSSLGGLTAARVAAEDARVSALFLMAPAFRIAARWRERLGPDALAGWKDTGAIEVEDHATKGKSSVHYAFIEELAALDAVDGGLPDVRVPTCIVLGRTDDVVDNRAAEAFAEGRPHVAVHWVDDGHELGSTLPEIEARFDDFIRPFFAGADKVRAKTQGPQP